MRIVYQTQILSNAYAVHAALLAEGIPAVVSGEHSVGIIGGGVSVHVGSDDDAEVARRVIEELRLE